AHHDANVTAFFDAEGTECDVFEIARERRSEATRAGFAAQGIAHDMIEDGFVDQELEAFELELAGHALNDVAAQDVLERARVERAERNDAREARDELREEAVRLEVGDVLDLLGREVDGDRVGVDARAGLIAAEADLVAHR